MDAKNAKYRRAGMPLSGKYEPSTSEHDRLQAETYERTDGEEEGLWGGKPIIVLTSVGAKTGRLRKTALMRVEHDGEYAVVASRAGGPEHPFWYWNLKENPGVELQDRASRHDYLAHEAAGEEYATWWERAVAAWPEYDEYRRLTTRTIPVFVLTRADDSALPA
jgi:deazaflavin-dependent oxidoreductase (nitroreductase family)